MPPRFIADNIFYIIDATLSLSSQRCCPIGGVGFASQGFINKFHTAERAAILPSQAHERDAQENTKKLGRKSRSTITSSAL